uniref:Uncharacterized protein n=1 Tax=Setaria viridis TaxID=4556 RepID=A0A4U6SSY0_SETVI|nr:LOW QUALITY PROTEIN: hypothetical protein SEVIR_9G092500v2 [Setaria viridis]
MNPVVFLLHVAVTHIISAAVLLLHVAVTIPLIIISTVVVLDRDALHEAELASASHVDERGAYVPLGRVLAEQLLLAELPVRAQLVAAGGHRHRVAAAEVADAVRVPGEPDPGVKLGVEVRAADVVPQRALRRVEGEGGGGGALLDADEDGVPVGVDGVGGDAPALERRGGELPPRPHPGLLSAMLRRRRVEQVEGAGSETEEPAAGGDVDGVGRLRRGEQCLPPPIFHVEGPRESPCHFVAAPDSKIVAIHPRDAQTLLPHYPVTVFDVRTRTIGFGRRPETNLTESYYPIYIPAGDGLFTLCHEAFRLLRPWPPAPGQCSAAPTLRALPCLPLPTAFVLSYAVHPDGRTIFVRVGGYCPNATLSFRMPEERDAEEGLAGWKPRGGWMLPSSGGGYQPAHFDGELNTWVGIRCDRDQDGYGHVCAVDVVPADPDAATGSLRPGGSSKEKLLSEDTAEETFGVTLLYKGGKSRFCLLESVCIEDRENNVAKEMEDREVELDDNGDLTTGDSGRIRYYSVPEGTSDRFVGWNPVALSSP